MPGSFKHSDVSLYSGTMDLVSELINQLCYKALNFSIVASLLLHNALTNFTCSQLVSYDQ